METPQQCSEQELYRLGQEFLQTKCVRQVSYTCKTCGSEIRHVTAFMSMHDSRFGDSCAGGGEVQRRPIPYCPHCEPKPVESGCIHI